ncbi:MAG TPA: hypothetical protein VLF94_01060 [Chlamydiales bacterium]|nr:hypothetical protein [Chlamydiales bacterium]
MRNLTRYTFLALVLSTPLFSQQTPPKQKVIAQGDIQFDSKKEPDVDDMEALRRWIRDKRMVTVREIGGDLSLSGEVRTEFQDTTEVRNGVRQRGEGAALEKPQYAWDVEVNIMIDYRTDRTWAAMRLEFDNDMGQRSGTVDKIRLEKAYLGGRIVPGDTLTIDSELGRRYLFDVYDSKLEFSSLFDGVLFRFSKAWPSVGDFYCNPGALLVDDKVNHYAYVVEVGALRIANVGLNIKYSLIDWYKPYANKLNNLRYKYLVSQLLFNYLCYPEWIGKRLIKFYGAALTNSLAGGVEQTNGRRQNWAWYAGVTLGLVKKQYDWSVDFNYQWVQAQAVPDFDASGIGRGNAAGVGFYTTAGNGDPTKGATTNATAVGGTNFKGFELQALYAFTDNLTVQQIFKYSTTLNTNIGPNIRYKQYEAEFIYAF